MKKRTLLAAAFVALSFQSSASADTYRGARVDREADLVLAIMCVGETGLRRPGWFAGCSAQVEVIALRAARRGWSLSTMARAYSSALKDPGARGWILELTRDGRRPPSLNSVAWESEYRPRFLRLLRLVQEQLAGLIPPLCPVADHFGAVHLDGHRADAAGWTRVCVGVHRRQGFWNSRGNEQ